MLLLAYQVFLTPRPGYENGLLRVGGYHEMALVAAGLMVVAILFSAIGTHREIKRLPRPVIERQSFTGHFSELAQTLKNRAFLVLNLAGVCVYTNQGTGSSSSNFPYRLVWS